MRIWIVSLVIAALGGFILYRSYMLESRVNDLTVMVRTAKSRGGSLPESGEKRIRELETKYKALSNKFETILSSDPAATKNAIENLDKLLASKHIDERVLSLLDAEKQKALDEQLKWNRDVVVKYRMDSLNYFAVDQKLSAGQLSALKSVLEDEVDKMVEILKNPELIGDQKKGLAAWVELIRETDKDAAEVLNEQQNKVFRHLRRLEQQALMPWLPEKDRS